MGETFYSFGLILGCCTAEIQAKIPVVIGHPIVAPCLRANVLRISLIVTSFPLGTFLINSFTSLGAGITIVPLPHLLLIFSVILSTLGRPCHQLICPPALLFSHLILSLLRRLSGAMGVSIGDTRFTRRLNPDVRCSSLWYFSTFLSPFLVVILAIRRAFFLPSE